MKTFYKSLIRYIGVYICIVHKYTIYLHIFYEANVEINIIIRKQLVYITRRTQSRYLKLCIVTILTHLFTIKRRHIQ